MTWDDRSGSLRRSSGAGYCKTAVDIVADKVADSAAAAVAADSAAAAVAS